MSVKYENLYDHINVEINYSRYWESEENVIKPALESKGFTVLGFSTGERDSFGPLSRICKVDGPNGIQYLVYG